MGGSGARAVSFGGLFLMMALALAFGENRRRISLRLVLAGLGLQLLFAVLGSIDPGRKGPHRASRPACHRLGDAGGVYDRLLRGDAGLECV